MSALEVYADRGCPYAHRVLAFAHQLGLAPTVHLARIGEKPAGLARYSASERIPLVVHGDVILTESRVILEYLAEAYSYDSAFPAHAAGRAVHRLAIELVDAFLTPRLTTALPAAQQQRFGEAVSVFEKAMIRQSRPSLFELQIAPIWQRLLLVSRDSFVVRQVRSHPTLASWLDDAVSRECIVATSTDPEQVEADFRRARELGLVDTDPFQSDSAA